MKKAKLDIRMLRGSDAISVKELDEISGSNVFGYIENIGPMQSTEDAWGIFDNGHLLGCCSTGGADGVISVPGMQSDAILLSDVFVRPECRGIGVATCMILEALSHFTGKDVYLSYLDERLEEFYKPLGFRRISGTDNVMLRSERDMSCYEVGFINGHTSKYINSYYVAICEDDAVKLAFRSHGSAFEHRLVSVRKMPFPVVRQKKEEENKSTGSVQESVSETSKLIADVKEKEGLLPKNPLVIDSDIILADLINQSGDFGFPGIAEDIFSIWERSTDKVAVEQMFYEFTGCDFKEYLKTCLCKIDIQIGTTSAATSADADVSGVVAVDIEWDVNEPEDIESLPEEVEIPKNVVEQQKENPDAISDYLTELTGFCHKGFVVIDHAETHELIRSGKVW